MPDTIVNTMRCSIAFQQSSCGRRSRLSFRQQAAGSNQPSANPCACIGIPIQYYRMFVCSQPVYTRACNRENTIAKPRRETTQNKRHCLQKPSINKKDVWAGFVLVARSVRHTRHKARDGNAVDPPGISEIYTNPVCGKRESAPAEFRDTPAWQRTRRRLVCR